MAKAKAQKKVNKSAAIREAFQANPKAKAKEIVATLASKGIKVTIPLVYYIKSHSRKKKRRQKREVAVSASRAAGMSNPVQAVIKVRALASEVGGMKSLKQLVDLLSE
jgi:DNA-binding winged helix-turn-helix (wHTH) protein